MIRTKNPLKETKALESPEYVEPLPDVPAPFDFDISQAGKITAKPSSANIPDLSRTFSAKDHAQRLEACRTVAEDIVEALKNGYYQARHEYLSYFQKYLTRLPRSVGTGNILLADAANRYLRSLFAAEHDQLSIAFASVLKVFLEQHIGLRAYYPEIATFYSDVRDGKLASPLPLDAVDGFVAGVIQHTPAIFDPNVSLAIGEIYEDAEVTTPLPEEDFRSEEGLPLPPPDPLGEIEAQRTQEFSLAGTINKLWKIFLDGEKIFGAAASWISAAKTLILHAAAIIEWLRGFLNGPNGGL